MRLAAAFAALLLALSHTIATAVPGDEFWSSGWSRAGTDQRVDATVEFAGGLVIGGDFAFVGEVAANRVAFHDGTAWTPLGEGFNGNVHALAVYGGELYAGGSFTASGATSTPGLARWTGSAWVAAHGGVEGVVEALTVFGTQLVAGGSITEVGGTTAVDGVAAWNGTSWSTLGGGVNSGGSVTAAAVFAGSLYVTGYFDIAGSTAANNIARWNGTTWSALGGGLTDAGGDPFEADGRDLEVWSGRLVVCGTFELAGTTSCSNLATWNGTTWSTLGSPTFFSLGAARLGQRAGTLYVHTGDGGGNSYLWNGATWVAFLTGAPVFVFGNYGTDLVAGGMFSRVGTTTAENVARFNGTFWSAMAGGQGASTGLSALHAYEGNLLAGGKGPRYGTVNPYLMAAWNGTAWSNVGMGIASNPGLEVTSFATLGTDLVVAGNFTNAGGTVVNRFARWNGSAWSAMGTSSATVQALLVMRGQIYAAAHTGTSYAVVRWDGTAWVSVGNCNDTVWDLAEYEGRLVAAGTFSTIGGTSVRGLAQWDSVAGTWNAIGASALNNTVFSLAVHDDTLYIGGTFTTLAGNAVNRVARWNGANWAALGTGVNNGIKDLFRFDGALFATGDFTQADGAPAAHIARWDGAAWHALGSGLNASGLELGEYDGELVVGGNFTAAGGRYSHGIATWADPGLVDAPPSGPGARRITFRAAPSPFTTRTTLTWTQPRTAGVRLRVHDVSGRVVATLAHGVREAGGHAITWDGRDARGERMGPGIYFGELVVDGVAATRRLVLTR